MQLSNINLCISADHVYQAIKFASYWQLKLTTLYFMCRSTDSVTNGSAKSVPRVYVFIRWPLISYSAVRNTDKRMSRNHGEPASESTPDGPTIDRLSSVCVCPPSLL